MSSGHISRKQIQTLPLNQKLGDSKKAVLWRKANVDYYIDRTNEYTRSRDHKVGLYKVAMGYLDESRYTYLTNPLNTNRSELKSYPAKLRNYDIISPLVQHLLGEKIEREIRPQVIAINSDIEHIKNETKKQLVKVELEKIAINSLNGIMDTGFSNNEPRPIEDIDKEVDNIKDEKSIIGGRAINYIIEHTDFMRKTRDGLFDYITVAETISIRDVLFNNVTYQNVSPIYCNYVVSEDTTFIEDGESASVLFNMTVSEVLDNFWDELSEKEVKALEARYNNDTQNRKVVYSETNTFMSSLVSDGKLNYNSLYVTPNTLQVYYVNWKSIIKIGKVTGYDILGNEYEFEVDEDYKKLPNETIEWRWVNQVWEGWRIDDDIYVGIRPLPYQRGKFDNPSECKLLINGRVPTGRHYQPKSIVEKLLPYQERYNGIHWHIEKLINKNKDKVLFLPKQLLSDDDNIDIEETMYFMDADGLLFGEGTDRDIGLMQQGIRVLDLSLNQHIRELFVLAQQIKSEAESLIGFNPQRKGQTRASDGKGVNDQAIFQASITTETLFKEFEEFEQRDLQSMLDLSKFAWKDGRKLRYIDDEKREAILNVEGEDYQELEFGIRVFNSGEENVKLNRIRGNAQALAQNAAADRPDLLIKLEKSNNIEEIDKVLEDHYEAVQVRAQQAQQAEVQANQQAQAREDQKHQDELDFKYYEANLKYDESLLALQSNLDSQISSLSADDTKDNSLELEKLQNDREKLQVEREKIQVQRETNRTALQNKVAGEK